MRKNLKNHRVYQFFEGAEADAVSTPRQLIDFVEIIYTRNQASLAC